MKKNHCLDCNNENYCLKCETGFYVAPSMASSEGGHCVKCSVNCLSCTVDGCSKCETGFINYPDKCIACATGCFACEESPTKCISCIPHYKLDLAGECYFRYGVVVVLGSIIGLFVILFVFFYCLGSLRRANTRRESMKETTESILGDEFRHTPSLISDVTQIGRHTETDKDLSLVMDSHEAAAHVNSGDDSIREDLFGESRERGKSGNQKLRSSNLGHQGKTKK